MAKQKFTVILLPLEEGGYQAFFPHHPGCIATGLDAGETLKNARDAMEAHLEALLETGGDDFLDLAYEDHVVVSEVEAEVPAGLSSNHRNAKPPKSRKKARASGES